MMFHHMDDDFYHNGDDFIMYMMMIHHAFVKDGLLLYYVTQSEMARGHSLEQDLRLLINNQKYSDIEILCENEKKLYGCRAILAARSEVFDRLFYNGMKETYENQISFPKINSSGMEIILEFTYTGSIKEESLTEGNTIEAFHAADYFQLSDLKDFIVKIVKNTLKKNCTENYSTRLLSRLVEIMPLPEDNILFNLLIDAVAIVPLNSIDFGQLSLKALQCLLSCTHEKEKVFVTPEYEVFRYSAILAARQVSNNAHKTLMERLPTLDQIENSNKVDNILFIADYQEIEKKLEPLVKFIDFRRIKGRILTDIIEPLKIIPSEIILNVYRDVARSNDSYLGNTRGIQLSNDYVWDKSACGSKLITEDDGKIVFAQNCRNTRQSVRAKILLANKENFNYETPSAGRQPTGWVLGSNGCCRHSAINTIENYCPSFGDGTKVTVHLDMNKTTCAFTVNDIKYPEVSEWNNLPSKLYPVVSLKDPGRFRIQPHQKN
ncbi:hypothetical protein RclHR1_03050004 [Rhizophagus clarus]|uniref:BTB domain-containing protein n=1 Tax=Rhizophagus clarus TaxID=94130 RepID=A0A2Z6R6D6_9GLOM|nr:hypothetical protein RclHR1_03050004 [Rhizophagus clarus]